MPPISTKAAPSALEADSTGLPRVARARRRLQARYYDRPEIRRTIAALVLLRVLRRTPPRRPRSGESP